MRPRYLFGAFLTGGIVFADLFIKRLVVGSFHLGERVEIIPGFFALTYVLNPGAAFGIMANWDSWLRFPVLVVASIVALGFIVYLYLGALSNNKIASIALPLIAGGALANLYAPYSWSRCRLLGLVCLQLPLASIQLSGCKYHNRCISPVNHLSFRPCRSGIVTNLRSVPVLCVVKE